MNFSRPVVIDSTISPYDAHLAHLMILFMCIREAFIKDFEAALLDGDFAIRQEMLDLFLFGGFQAYSKGYMVCNMVWYFPPACSAFRTTPIR